VLRKIKAMGDEVGDSSKWGDCCMSLTVAKARTYYSLS